MAKVEFEITGKKIAITILLLAIGIIAGYLIAGAAATKPSNSQGGANCLTIQDLNRQDLIGVIQLSRFCEGMGFASNLLWQQDNNGNSYALPVCVQPNS